MAEITETNAPLEQTQVDANAELAQQMSIALNNGLIPQEQVNTETQTETATTETTIDAPTSTVSFDTLKEKFSYENPEAAIKEIEELRAFKSNPVAEIEFENEASKKLFEAIKGGKQKEAYAILAEQDILESFTSVEVTKDNAADIIKLGMKYKYKDLTPSEIDYKYKKQFSLPKEPIQNSDELDEDFLIRQNDWKSNVSDIEMERIMEAKLIKPELESRKTKLILPDIEADIDADYTNWKNSQAETAKVQAETETAYKTFTPKSIETKINFNDEANKVAFEYQYEPTAEDLSKTVEMVTDINKFYNLFIGQDGKPDRQGFLRAIHFAVNSDKILMGAMNQSKNATIKALLPNNNNGGMVRQMAQGQQVSELDEQMRRAGVSR